VVGMNAVSYALARNTSGICPTRDWSTKDRDTTTSATRTDAITMAAALAFYLPLSAHLVSVRTNPPSSHDRAGIYGRCVAKIGTNYTPFLFSVPYPS